MTKDAPPKKTETKQPPPPPPQGKLEMAYRVVPEQEVPGGEELSADSAPPEEGEGIDIATWELTYQVRRSRIYHEHRRAFMVGWGRFVLFLIVLFGSGAATEVATQHGASFWLSLAAAALAAASLVFGPHDGARVHEVLYRRFVDLEADLESEPDRISHWKKRLHTIEADEPPIYGALNAVCYNELNHSLGIKERQLISFCARLTKNYLRYSGKIFPT